MAFCSFQVLAPDVMPIPGYLIVLDRGHNVFNAEVPDLEAFQAMLADLGCTVTQVNRLDEFEEAVPDIFLTQ